MLLDYEVVGNYATRLGEWTRTPTPEAEGDPIVETGEVHPGLEKYRRRVEGCVGDLEYF